jgi:hypothetical protein
VWLLEVRYGGKALFCTVHSSKEAAVAFLARWCRGCWAEQGHGQQRDLDEVAEQPLPGDDQGAVERYFEYWAPEESYCLAAEEIDPKHDGGDRPQVC